MSGRRPIPQRKRIFVACEGESEQSYAAVLARLIEPHHRRIHLDAVLVQPGGGDPLAIVERAARLLQDRVRRLGRYHAHAVLLDGDKLGLVPDRDRQIAPLAARHRLLLIWQEPCHEALLLRHVEGCERLRPADTHRAVEALLRRCPNYRKGMPASRLTAFIDETGVRRAADVEPALREFLSLIEFPAG